MINFWDVANLQIRNLHVFQRLFSFIASLLMCNEAFAFCHLHDVDQFGGHAKDDSNQQGSQVISTVRDRRGVSLVVAEVCLGMALKTFEINGWIPHPPSILKCNCVQL